MQISLNFATLLLICMAITGCNEPARNPTDVGGPSSVHSWSKSGDSIAGTVYCVGTLFAIWTDSPNGGGGNESANLHGVTFRGHIITSDQGQVNFSGESTDGRTGTVVIDGNSFEIKNGNLFVVATGDDGYRVKQLKCDLSKLQVDRKALQEFAKADSEMNEFFGDNHEEQEAH